MFFALLTELILAFVSCSFFIYAIFEWKNTKKGVNKDKKPNTENFTNKSINNKQLHRENLPTACVLLPVYNEVNVVERLIDAVSQLEYPKDKLEIWLLDDSVNTMPLAKDLVEKKYEAGVPIHYAHRGNNKGFKAGNLNYGLSISKGDFVAIFDADFIPEKEFLLKTIPIFENKEVGYLQTSVDYTNKNHSILTKFQAMMAHHKEDVTLGQSKNDFIASLTGSSCVWRRECIEQIGGIADSTISEDMDMGLRAQQNKWKYCFVDNVVSFAELPEVMAVFRVQRERWGRGHFQNSFKHCKNMLSTAKTFSAKTNALALMLAPLLLVSFYIMALLCLPLTFLTPHFSHFYDFFCSLFLFSAILWAFSCLLGNGEKTVRTDKKKNQILQKKTISIKNIWIKFKNIYAYIVIFFPHSLYYFHALLHVSLKRNGQFNPTPKGEVKINKHKLNDRLLFLEIFSFIYSLITIYFSMLLENYWISLYSFIACSGFALGLYLSYCDNKKFK